MPNSQDVLARIDREKTQTLDELIELLKIPSVSTDPEFADEVGLHSPNERYAVDQLYGGIRSVVRILDRMP